MAITTILESNGLDDALWCLKAVDGYQNEIRLYAVDCARMVQHLLTDPRSIAAIDVAERYANGLATYEELVVAKDAAMDVAGDADDRAAAVAAAVVATEDASMAANWAAAMVSDWDAARSAAIAAVDAARASAGAYNWESAMAAARGYAGVSVWGAAMAAAREVQADLLRIVCIEIEHRE